MLNDEWKNEIIDLLKQTDFNIDDIDIEMQEIKNEKPKAGQEIKHDVRINTIHKKFDSNNNTIGISKLNLFTEGSEGTKRLFALSAPVLDTLKHNGILVIDEFDTRLHPILAKYIIQLFHSNKNNLNMAQLIIVSHNTLLLDKDIFRRDQIWFTEKNEYNESKLYSLIDYKIRKDASFEKDYILGKYGSIPYIQSNDNILRKK